MEGGCLIKFAAAFALTMYSWMMQTTLHRPAPLTVTGVFAALRQMAVEKGPGSAGRRQRSVLALLRSCRWGTHPCC